MFEVRIVFEEVLVLRVNSCEHIFEGWFDLVRFIFEYFKEVF